MAWEQFKRKMRPSPKSPSVTLGAGGQIGLNVAVTRNLLADNRFALLFFDREKSRIGIRFMKESNPDAYPVKLTKNLSHGAITGTAFLKTYGIYPTETTNCPTSWDLHERILIVDVSGVLEPESVRAVKKKGRL
jgi:hypothetical protein